MKTANPFVYSDSNKRYHTFDYYLKHRYGCKCAKIPLDGNFTCPNRDGSKGVGGCTFCSSRGSGDFCASPVLSLREQFNEQKKVYERKWGDVKYIQYFQSHTATHCSALYLRTLLDEALTFENTVGISLATRADCLSDEIIALLFEYSKKTDLTVELGLQSIHDKTAEKINRCMSYAEFLDGYEKLCGLDICVHLINGLPGETQEMMLESAKEIARLHPKYLKIHLLHILSGTKMADEYQKGEFECLSLDDYVKTVVSQLEIIPGDIVIERVTGDGKPDFLIAPQWSLKKFCVMNEIDKEFVKRDSFQGVFCI